MEQKKDKGANINDSRSLSGGERSFSTICFIMSMWDAMEGPFRCLDEFDVFMVSKIINYTLILSYSHTMKIERGLILASSIILKR